MRITYISFSTINNDKGNIVDILINNMNDNNLIIYNNNQNPIHFNNITMDEILKMINENCPKN